jgi:threonine/homoserine/homoserine lactone efflux protein
MLYVLARTAAGGRLAGFRSAAGTAVGGSFHVIAAALGVSALVAASSKAYTVVCWLGAAYLIYLGIKTLLEKSATAELHIGIPKYSFTQGIVTEILNPKTAVFFLAFVPPFVRQRGAIKHIYVIPDSRVH